MFTGIIEAIGRLEAVALGSEGGRLSVSTPPEWGLPVVGESIAVDGACLTVESSDPRRFSASASPETLDRTTLGQYREGRAVNLERALRAGARLGGHIVTGHVDARGRIRSIVPRGNSRVLAVDAPESILPLCVEKGSIAVNGVSLTIAGLDSAGFWCAIVPHTWTATTFSRLESGEGVNLESDLIAKYVSRLLGAGRAGDPGVSWQTLADAGFLE